MLYRNITDKPQYISSGMIKRKIQPGKTVNLSPADMAHAGSNIRHFESVVAAQTVTEKGFAIVPDEEKDSK